MSDEPKQDRVEAAARAIHNEVSPAHSTWAALHDDVRESYRIAARQCVTLLAADAAAPAVAVPGWQMVQKAFDAFSKATSVPGGPSLAMQRHDPTWAAWKNLCDAFAAAPLPARGEGRGEKVDGVSILT